jgi:cyclic-di-AMP phosphodiesterase PgpH
MALLDKLGLGPKKPRPVGQRLERGRDNDRRGARTNVLVKASIFLALVVSTLAAFPQNERYDYLVDPGETWRRETVVAPFDFAIYKDPAVIEAERQQVRFQTPPYFRAVPGAIDAIEANRDTLDQQLDRIFSVYSSYRSNMAAGRQAEALRDSLQYLDQRRNARLKLTPAQWQILVRAHVEQGGVGDQLLQSAWEVSDELARAGVLDLSSDSIATDQVVIRNERDLTDVPVEMTEIHSLDEAYETAQARFQAGFADRPQLAGLAYAIFRVLFQPTHEYLLADTVREWQRMEDRISPTQGIVREGEVIVREEDRVTEDILRRLQSLARVQSERSGINIFWKVGLGQLLLTLTTYVLFFLYLFLLRRQIFNDNRQILLVALLFVGIIALYAITIRMPSVAMYAVPVAIISVLLTVIFDSRVGLFGTLTLALIGGHLLSYDFEFAFATIFAGALGVFSVRDVRNRGQFFLSSGLVFIGYAAVLSASWLIEGTPTQLLLSDLLLVLINSFLLLLAYPLLWVFERAFDITTDLTLLELSDTNRPLLKELSLRAPGTFNHSLQVANLAEAAADAVGANALLTRVGALYHDVGKMLKPEYFVENQRPGDNPHDNLKPRMSALIIASHVKEGLEMGRQYKLPQRVLKFIPMHHGTTRIEYFYRKALDQRMPEEPAIQESEFRYPGPRPDAKETGILMLADSVEAASRSLSEPTHKRLEMLIEALFKARIEDGQLDDTLLTFRDLNIIRETFLSMLLGIYHVRVRYPGQSEDEQGLILPSPAEKEHKQETAEVATTVKEREPQLPAPTGDEGGSQVMIEDRPALPNTSGSNTLSERVLHAQSREIETESETPQEEENLDLDPARRAQLPTPDGLDLEEMIRETESEKRLKE